MPIPDEFQINKGDELRTDNERPLSCTECGGKILVAYKGDQPIGLMHIEPACAWFMRDDMDALATARAMRMKMEAGLN